MQLALNEINDERVFIIPRDAGLNNKEKIKNAIEDIKKENVNIIIGPISNENFSEVKKYNDLIFVSPSNISPDFQNNIISLGISLELTIKDFSKIS